MVKYNTQQPCEALSDYVRFFWTLEATVGSMEPFVHRALPYNCLELILYCQGRFSIRASSGAEGHTFTSGAFGQAQKHATSKRKMPQFYKNPRCIDSNFV
jgi:hypothetical protein